MWIKCNSSYDEQSSYRQCRIIAMAFTDDVGCAKGLLDYPKDGCAKGLLDYPKDGCTKRLLDLQYPMILYDPFLIS